MYKKTSTDKPMPKPAAKPVRKIPEPIMRKTPGADKMIDAVKRRKKMLDDI